MRAIKVLAFAALLSACAVLGADELTWKSLFAPPYASMPEICLSIACVSRDLCYLPGGSNGQGFGVYSFNGQTNGEMMQMNEPNMTMMIMTAAAGGTTKNPRGAFGGFGMLSVSDALQYLDNGTTWLPSHTPFEFIWVTQSMAATDDGQHIISLGSGPAGNSIMHSANSGLSFNPQVLNIPPLQADCTAPNYAAMVNNQTWYITLGGYPGEHKNSNSGSGSNGGGSGSGSNSGSNGNNAHSIQTLKRNSAISAIQRHANGRVSHAHGRKAAKLPEVTDHCHFTGQIARTNDAGKTWEIMLNSTEYTLSQIDCVSANHCVTTGWGTLANNDTLVVVLTMTDGKTWKETLRLVNSPLSFNAVKFADAQEVWLAGGLDTQAAQAGAFYMSKDGGMTWSAFPGLIPDVVMIMDMDFTKDGVGFAVGMTVFKTATILRYEKQSFAGYFSQANCPFKGCTALCQNVTFPQGMCMEVQGGSTIATCSATAIEQRIYNTTSCVGPYTVVPMPINQCLNSTQGSFFENYCNTSALDATPRSSGLTF